MDEDPGGSQTEKAHDLEGGGNEVQLLQSIDHHGHGRTGVDKAPQVNLAQGDNEAGIDREQEHEIELTSADILRNLGTVGEKKCLENLLNEVARAHQQNHLPLRPIANVIGVLINHRDEGQLQAEPEQLNDDPEQEVGLETHLANDGVLPQRGVQI